MDMTTVWFDMDGTIANLYKINNWLKYLQDEKTTPYEVAQPMLHFASFARMLHRLQQNGYKIGIITWGAKTASASFNMAVEIAKRQWLKKHLPSVIWDDFQFFPYGTDKNNVNAGNDILFDDEEHNRANWQGPAYEPNQIKTIVKGLI